MMRSHEMRDARGPSLRRHLTTAVLVTSVLAGADAGAQERVDAAALAREVGAREARAAREVRELVVLGWTNGRPSQTRYIRANDGPSPWSVSAVGEGGTASLAQQNLMRWLAEQPAFLASQARAVRYVARDTAGGRPAHVLEVREADGGAMGTGSGRGRYWIDAERGDLLRIRLDGARTLEDGRVDSVTTVVDLADWRAAGATRVPFRTVVSLRRGAMLPDSARRAGLYDREQALQTAVTASFGDARRAAESDLRVFRALVYHGRLESVIEVREVHVNGRRVAPSDGDGGGSGDGSGGSSGAGEGVGGR